MRELSYVLRLFNHYIDLTPLCTSIYNFKLKNYIGSNIV